MTPSDEKAAKELEERAAKLFASDDGKAVLQHSRALRQNWRC